MRAFYAENWQLFFAIIRFSPFFFPRTSGLRVFDRDNKYEVGKAKKEGENRILHNGDRYANTSS